MNNIKPELEKYTDNGNVDWDGWLSEFENKLSELGYRKYCQNHRYETFCYKKTFKEDNKKLYQVGILFYDFRKYKYNYPSANHIGIMYDCILLGKDSIDMTVSKEIDVPAFEEIAKKFYNTMSEFIEYELGDNN